MSAVSYMRQDGHGVFALTSLLHLLRLRTPIPPLDLNQESAAKQCAKQKRQFQLGEAEPMNVEMFARADEPIPSS